jgi:hypothetical protein
MKMIFLIGDEEPSAADGVVFMALRNVRKTRRLKNQLAFKAGLAHTLRRVISGS